MSWHKGHWYLAIRHGKFIVCQMLLLFFQPCKFFQPRGLFGTREYNTNSHHSFFILDTFQLQKVFLSAYIGHSAYMLYLPQFMTRKGLYRNFNYDSASWKLKNANSSNWSYWKHVYSTSASVVYVFIGHNSHPLLIITLYWRILW